MYQIIFLISLYFLTQLGYFLGNITKEEHKELKKFIDISVIILINIVYAIFIYLYFNSKYIYFILILYFIYITSIKKEILKPFHNILLLVISFSILNLKIDYKYILIIIVFAIMLENSFNKINYKQSFYEIVILLIVYFIFSIF